MANGAASREGRWPLAWRVGGGYLAISWLWILGSDATLTFLHLPPGLLHLAQTFKGTLFILVSAGLLYRVTWRWEQVAIREEKERENAQNALAESESRFRQLAETIQEVFWLTDLKKQEVLYVNPAYETIWGGTFQSLRESPGSWLESIHPDDRPAVLDALPGQALGQYDQVYRVVAADGTVRWVHDRAFPVRDTSGKVVRLAGVARDITEERRVQEELRVSEERYRRLVEFSPFGIFTQRQGRFTFVNGAFAKMLGRDRQDLVGHDIWEVIHHEERASVDRILADAKEGREQVQTCWQRRMLHAGGEYRAVETSIVPYFVEGQLEVLVVARDLTESHQTQRELARKGALLASIVETSLHAILTVSETGDVVLLNPAARKIFGYADTDPDGLKVTDLLPFSLESATGSYHLRTGRRQSGEEFPVEVCTAPLPGLALTIVTCCDVTEQEKAKVTQHNLETQLRQSQKMEAVGQLAGGIAHDFNNLLTIIMTGACLLRDGVDDGPELLKEIIDAAERASQLTRQLLTFSRKQVMHVRSVDLSMIVKTTVSMLRRTLGEDITLTTATEPDLPATRGDSGMLQQVLLNLALNARDAMPDGGSLRIQICRRTLDTETATTCLLPGPPGDYLCLEVTDSGVGISPETLPHIFEPFFTTKEVGQGTGLGLATVWGIAEQHNALLQVTSSDEGTTFGVYLPVAAETAAGHQGAGDAKLLAGAGGILLVEDDAALRRLLTRLLRGCGYKIFSANNGREALGVWKTHHAEVDVLLTDMVMPEGVGGLELARTLQKERKDLKVILCSGYSSQFTAATQSGAFFLSKPFLPDKLTTVVRDVMEGRVKATLCAP